MERPAPMSKSFALRCILQPLDEFISLFLGDLAFFHRLLNLLDLSFKELLVQLL